MLTWEDTLKHLGLANFLILRPLQPLRPEQNVEDFFDGGGVGDVDGDGDGSVVSIVI